MKETSLLKLKIFSLDDLFVADITDNIELQIYLWFFWKNQIGAIMELSGPGPRGRWFMKKPEIKKSFVTVPLNG